MYLVTATVPAETLPEDSSLGDTIRQLALPEDRLEHIHLHPAVGGGAHLTLFLDHPDSRGTEAAAARLVARALPAKAESALEWAPATPLLSAFEQLALGTHDGPDDRELPSQEPDTR
ncbi:hypothetical protein [Streptomyces sp. NPDC059166]|uniref:hypothetical protein n=1 Tax=Streptomyces sp. NPDC059166 TaxID=3346752 RepID=UPI003693E0AD